jgi:hypothetical protein
MLLAAACVREFRMVRTCSITRLTSAIITRTRDGYSLSLWRLFAKVQTILWGRRRLKSVL